MKCKFIFTVFLFFVVFSSHSQLSSNLSQNGLIGYWPFDGNAEDISGNTKHGIVNNVNLTVDRFGRQNMAYDFNGANNSITINTKINSSSITLSFWFKTPPSNKYSIQYLFGFGSKAPSNYGLPGFGISGLEKVCNSQANKVLLFDAINACSNVFYLTDIESSQWYHGVIVKTNSNISFYNNGRLVWSGVINNLNFDDLIIGKRLENWLDFNGSIDDVALWNRALSEKEIAELNNVNQENQIETLDEYYNQGIVLYDKDLYSQSISFFDKSIQLNAQNYLSFFKRGSAKYFTNDLIGAISDIENSIKLNSNYPKSYVQLGNIKKDQSDYSSAIYYYSKAIELIPVYGTVKLEDAYYSRGLMYRDIGDNNNFLNDFNRVLEINPNRSYAYIYMASTKLKQGDFNSALGLINKSIELNPNEPTAHYTKGRILFISKDYKGCKLSLDKAISLNPLDSDFYLIRALAEAGLGENENCCLDFKKAIELGNEDAIKFDKELNVQEYCDKKDNTNDYLTKQFYLGILDGMKNYNNNSSTSSVSTNNSVQGNSSNVTNSNSTSSPQKTEPFEFEVTVKWSSPTNNVAKCGLNLTVENGVLGMGPNYESNSCGFSVDPVCPKCKKKLLNVSSCNGFAYQNPHKSFEKFKVRCPNCSY